MGGVVGREQKGENDVIIVSKERNIKNNKVRDNRKHLTLTSSFHTYMNALAHTYTRAHDKHTYIPHTKRSSNLCLFTYLI